MGVDLNEGFTPEELVELGEVEPQEEPAQEPGNPEPGTEGEPAIDDPPADPGQEPEQPAEPEPNVDPDKEGEQEPEPGGQEPVPGEPKSNLDKRIDALTWEKNETKRELELIKTLGVEKYYELHPDKAPADYKAPAPKNTQPTPAQVSTQIQDTSPAAAANLIVDSGTHKGKTLAEVQKVDPMAAADLYISWKLNTERANDEVRAEQAKQATAAEEEKAQAERDVSTFKETFAKNHYGKEDLKALSSDEVAGVDGALQQVIDFISDPKNHTTNLDVAYTYLFKDKIIEDALKNGARNLGNKLKQNPGHTVQGGSGDRPAGNKWESFEQMSEHQMVSKMNNMSEKEYGGFLKDAPQSLKDKFPGIDWDPI